MCNEPFKIFRFLSWLFAHVKKSLDCKDKINFKIYDVATSFTNNCNTATYCPISHEIKTTRQWNLGKYYNITRELSFIKNHKDNGVVIHSLLSIYFDRSWLGMQEKQTVWSFRLLIQSYSQFFFFGFLKKGLAVVTSQHFAYNFPEYCFSCHILLTDEISFFD